MHINIYIYIYTYIHIYIYIYTLYLYVLLPTFPASPWLCFSFFSKLCVLLSDLGTCSKPYVDIKKGSLEDVSPFKHGYFG